MQPILCASIPGLVPKQLRFCRNYVEIMPSVAEGLRVSIQECQHQFRGRRWNCTTVNNSLAIFGPVLDKGTPSREGATYGCSRPKSGAQLCLGVIPVHRRESGGSSVWVVLHIPGNIGISDVGPSTTITLGHK